MANYATDQNICIINEKIRLRLTVAIRDSFKYNNRQNFLSIAKLLIVHAKTILHKLLHFAAPITCYQTINKV